MKTHFNFLAIVGVLMVSGSPSHADVNSWTNPASAHWEDRYWSLDALPASSQSVFITNSGYKAVGIFPSTSANFPAALSVRDLTISAPANGLSTLLLNYAGTAVPLHVLNYCNITTNGTLLNYYSAFQVGGFLGGLTIDSGTFQQEGGITIATNVPSVVNLGTLSATNATLIFSDLYLEGLLEQSGGNTTFATLFIGSTNSPGPSTQSGRCNLHGGTLAASWLLAGLNSSGTITQYAGAVQAATLDDAGDYHLLGGQVYSQRLAVGPYARSGFFYQSTGTVSATTLQLGSGPLQKTSGSGSYYLTNGSLLSGDSFIGGSGAIGDLHQDGGNHFVTNQLLVAGALQTGSGVGRPSHYYLNDGSLSSQTETLQAFSDFEQNGGSNVVNGTLNVASLYYVPETSYFLNAGSLITSNTLISASGFQQGGGVHVVRGTLSLVNNGGSANYYLNGGVLSASNIFCSGSFRMTGGTISNPGEFALGGLFTLTNQSVQCGAFVLSGNAVISPGGSGGVVRFAPSNSKAWTASAILRITNWHGSLNGAGTDQIFFGYSATGLTTSQLAQIQFGDPTGLPAGVYSASILPTGEIVPNPLALLSMNRSGGGSMVIAWAGGLTLQRATNLAGPFIDIADANSPLTNYFTNAPQAFFRLRH